MTVRRKQTGIGLRMGISGRLNHLSRPPYSATRCPRGAPASTPAVTLSGPPRVPLPRLAGVTAARSRLCVVNTA